MPSIVTLNKRRRIVVPKEIRKVRRSAVFVNDPLWLAVHNPAESKVLLTKERLEKWEEELWIRVK